MSNEVTSQ